MLKTMFLAGASSVLALTASTALAQATPEAATPETATPETAAEAPAASPAAQAAETTAAPAADATTANTPAADDAAAPAVVPVEGTIAAAVASNDDLSTLSNALSAAELTATLGQAGPYTVFAPTNAAFDLIPADTRNALMHPANKASLETLLKFHVVEGNVTLDNLRQQIEAGGGSAQLQTIAGQTLTASIEGAAIALSGENNSKAYIAMPDQDSSNGTVHVVNGILVPRLG